MRLESLHSIIFANWNGNEGFVIVSYRRPDHVCGMFCSFFSSTVWYPKKTFFAYFSFECSHACFGGCLAVAFAFQVSLTSFPSWCLRLAVGGRDTWTTSCLDWFQGEFEQVMTAWVAFPCCLMETNWSLMAAVLFLDMEPTRFRGVAVCSDVQPKNVDVEQLSGIWCSI